MCNFWQVKEDEHERCVVLCHTVDRGSKLGVLQTNKIWTRFRMMVSQCVYWQGGKQSRTKWMQVKCENGVEPEQQKLFAWCFLILLSWSHWLSVPWKTVTVVGVDSLGFIGFIRSLRASSFLLFILIRIFLFFKSTACWRLRRVI